MRSRFYMPIIAVGMAWALFCLGWVMWKVGLVATLIFAAVTAGIYFALDWSLGGSNDA